LIVRGCMRVWSSLSPLAIEGLSAATGDRRIRRAEISASGLRHFRWRHRPSGVANRPVSIGPRGEVEAKLRSNLPSLYLEIGIPDLFLRNAMFVRHALEATLLHRPAFFRITGLQISELLL
jgi:hypothetical protein